MSIEVNATEQIIEVNATGSTIDINVNSQTVDVNATTSVIDVNVTNGPGPGVPDGGLTGQVLKKLSNADYDTYWAADTVGVPYIGATGNVDLGEFELKAGQIEFDQTPTGTAGVAVTRWNDTVGTIETTLKGGNVVFRHGRDMFERVVNKTGIQLTKAAYQAVRISDAQGQRLAVQLAQANNDNNSADTIGLVVETIDNNQEGYIYTVGELQNINTTGSLQGETWADGDVLYLSPTTAGRITNVKPVAPQHLVVIGYVVYAHQNNGKIFVKITNGFELGELHDVDTTGATSGQVLTYNGTIWTPQTNAAGNIYNTDGTLTGNRTVTMGTNTLSFTRDLLVNGITVGIGNIGDNTRYNTVLGWRALFNPTSKSRNTAIGSESLTSATTGSFNTAVGNESLYALTTGTENTAVGDLGLDSVTTGAGNVSLGAFAMRHLITGNYNIGIGYDTNLGVDTTAGSYNTLLGAQSTIGDTSGSNNTVIGARINASGNYSNNIILGDGSGNMRLVFNSSGDAVLGGSTTYPTFSGFKLDVLGSGRFSGNLTTNVTANSIVKTNASGVLTAAIAGTDYQLPITNPITGTGATGQVAYWSGTNTQTGSNNLFWDATNNRLGIGTNSPITTLTIGNATNYFNNSVLSLRGGILFDNGLVPVNAGTLSSGDFNFIGNRIVLVNTSAGSVGGQQNLQINRASLTFDGGGGGNIATITRSAGSLIFDGNHPTTGDLQFRTAGTERFRIFPTGNVLIQNGGTFTDGGQRLQVQGDAFIRGSGNTSGTTALTVQNSDGNNLLRVRNDGFIQIGSASTFPYIAPINRATTALSLTGEGILFQGNGNSAGTDFAFNGNNITATSGGLNLIFLGKSFIPSSGTATYTQLLFQPVINQTGGANGITRGLYVNPTLTAAADWRSIEWSNNTGWGLYGAGTSNNHLGGSLGIGSVNVTQFGLRVAKNITGSLESYGISSGGFVQSDVTASGIYYDAVLQTQATTFTVSNIYGYRARVQTIGAGSTITNMFGYSVESSLISGTNNYGFFGNIPSGTGRWNLFMNGTAANYLNGNTIIGGSAVDAGFKLDVQGGNVRINKNDNTSTSLEIVNTTNNNNANSNLILTANSTAGSGQIFKYSTLRTAYKTISGNDFGIYNGTAGNMSFLNDIGKITFSAGGSTSTYFEILTSGTSIFKNDVNGSFFLTVSNITSGTNAQTYFNLVSDSAAGELSIGKHSTLKTAYKIISSKDGYLYNNTIGGDICILNDFATGSIKLSAGGQSTAQMTLTAAGRFLIGTTTENTSAILNVTSTTQGFLPPRMTTTQKNAIATPAAGLVVYDNTTNKLCCYNGTTWNDLF